MGSPTHIDDFNQYIGDFNQYVGDSNPLTSSHPLSSEPELTLSPSSFITVGPSKFFAKETELPPQDSLESSTTLTSPLFLGVNAELPTTSSSWLELDIPQESFDSMSQATLAASMSDPAVISQTTCAEWGNSIQTQDEQQRQQQRQPRDCSSDYPTSIGSPSSHSSTSQTSNDSLQPKKIASQPVFRCSSCQFSHGHKATLE